MLYTLIFPGPDDTFMTCTEAASKEDALAAACATSIPGDRLAGLDGNRLVIVRPASDLEARIFNEGVAKFFPDQVQPAN